MTAHLADPVTLWNAAGVPVRLIWEGRRYRVSGYRMQITGEDGASVVVDVHLRTGGAELVAVYD
jgi:hypothetical protein